MVQQTKPTKQVTDDVMKRALPNINFTTEFFIFETRQDKTVPTDEAARLLALMLLQRQLSKVELPGQLVGHGGISMAVRRWYHDGNE